MLLLFELKMFVLKSNCLAQTIKLLSIKILSFFEIISRIDTSLLLRIIIARYCYNYKQTSARLAKLCFDKNI